MNETPDFFDLDELQLDVEWNRQAKLYHEHKVQLADLRKEYEEVKADKDVVRAEVAKEIRSDPAQFELTKVTEGSIEETIILDDRFKKASRRVIKAKHAVEIAEAVVDALEHRKKALEAHTQLFCNDYHAEPRVPKNADMDKIDGFRMKMRKERRLKKSRN